MTTSDDAQRPASNAFGNRYWRLPVAGETNDASPISEPGSAPIGTPDTATFRLLADNIASLCWIANADGYIVWYNRRWHDYCGTTPAEMEGWGWQSVHDPATLPAVMDRWTRSIGNGEPFEMTFPLRGADGVFRPFLTRIVPWKNTDGTIERWYGNNVDVSAQQAVEGSLRDREEQLKQLNETLERRVEDRTTQHLAIEAQLRQSQKLEAVGQLTGGVAHDFNNLLTVIRGSVDLLQRDDLPEEKRRRYIDAIRTTADRAAMLTSQLLAFARRQALKPELFDAGESLREVSDMIRTLTGSRIVLDIQTPKAAYHLLADRNQFDTSIVNMAINARDAMHGEGRLTIATGPVSGIPEIRSHPPIVGEFIAVTITDSGQGIAKENLGRIFEPFYTTKEVGHGTGLGLSQVIGFAKQSGGDIRVASVVGEGTTFTLYLPRAEPGVDAAADHAVQNAPVDGAGLCVLVVEDNEQVGEFATAALKELGFDSVHVGDAQRALAELANDCDRFHIVFSDVVMPGMSGIELGDAIRERFPNVPVVLTSGYSHVLANNGSHGFELLHKPYSIEQLSRTLQKAIRWRGGARAP